MLGQWPAADPHFVATSDDPVRADNGLTVLPSDTSASLADPDIVLVGGASKPLDVLGDTELVDYEPLASGAGVSAGIDLALTLYAATKRTAIEGAQGGCRSSATSTRTW